MNTHPEETKTLNHNVKPDKKEPVKRPPLPETADRGDTDIGNLNVKEESDTMRSKIDKLKKKFNVEKRIK